MSPAKVMLFLGKDEAISEVIENYWLMTILTILGSISDFISSFSQIWQ